MRKNLNNLALLLIVGLVFALACGTYKGIGDSDAPKVVRGRLKFAKSVTALNIGRDPIYRDVKQGLFVDGKEWSPEGEPKFADKLNWCDTSPNPNVEILRCFGDITENYKTTYILQMKNDKPELQKIDEGLPSIWINDDGRWLLFKKFYVNVETGEKINIKVEPFSTGEEGYVYAQYVIAVSPDMKTIVSLFDTSEKTEGAEQFLIVQTLDIETGKIEKRKVSYTKNPWLIDHENPKNDIQPPPAQSKKFVWKRGADGKDKIVVPQLLEKVER